MKKGNRITQNIEFWYLLKSQMILERKKRQNRTGTPTYSKFFTPLTHCAVDGFPLFTTKKMFWRGIVGELLWFLGGHTNVKWLNDRGIHIWDEWADPNGDVGNIYGKQWRAWEGSDGKPIDQIANLIDGLKSNPNSRRHIISAWNVGDIYSGKVRLPPCHMTVQFYVENNNLSLTMYQRSADWFLGVPFNVASYALLLEIVAKQVGLTPHVCHYVFGDTHIYENHVDQMKLQASRELRMFPTVVFEKKPIDEYKIDDFKLLDYDPLPAIKAPIAV